MQLERVTQDKESQEFSDSKNVEKMIFCRGGYSSHPWLKIIKEGKNANCPSLLFVKDKSQFWIGNEEF